MLADSELQVDDIVEDLKGLTLLEASELVKAIEESCKKTSLTRGKAAWQPLLHGDVRRPSAWTLPLRQGQLSWRPPAQVAGEKLLRHGWILCLP